MNGNTLAAQVFNASINRKPEIFNREKSLIDRKTFFFVVVFVKGDSTIKTQNKYKGTRTSNTPHNLMRVCDKIYDNTLAICLSSTDVRVSHSIYLYLQRRRNTMC